MEPEKLKELEETVLRLHVYLRRLETEHDFKKLTEKIENGKPGIWNKKDKILVSELLEYQFYNGKMLAYMYCLAHSKNPEVVMLVERLRNMVLDEKNNRLYQS